MFQHPVTTGGSLTLKYAKARRQRSPNLDEIWSEQVVHG
jgi:hypothetical protein